MPKDPTASRSRGVAAPPKAPARKWAGAPSTQPPRPLPPRAGNPPRPSTQGIQRQPLELRKRAQGKDTRVEDSDSVHADCRVIFKTADKDRRQLLARLKEASETARKLNAEKIQSNAQFRKLTSELNELKQKNMDLQQHLDMSNLSQQSYVLREEHERVLEDLRTSVTRTIESKKNESQNVYLSGCMPSSDVAQDSWAQHEQFGMLDNPVMPDNPAPMLSASDPLAVLPDFDTYETMPGDVA